MDRLSRFFKASPNDAAWDELMAFAQKRLEPILAAAFLSALQKLRFEVDVATVLRWIMQDGPQKVATRIVAGIEPAAFQSLQDGLVTAVRAAANFEARQAHIVLRFDPNPNEAVLTYVRNQGGQLIQEISESTRQGIVQYLEDGLRQGLNPNDIARRIKDIIGLTARQAQAVANYRRYLEQADPRILERALRDRRFDRTLQAVLQGRKQLSPEQIDTMTARYRERFLKYRAETIARTESITALHNGQRALWDQAVSRGLARPDELVRLWYVARDERVCDVCAPIPGMNPAGVGIHGSFVTPDGPVYGPALHPNCRCVVFVRPVIRGAT